MGYPAFNKMTIQLPIPSATMTKAEYKETYGIDLDDLDFAKVTLLIDGKNKYAVDEIKIVSDDVLILAGGKVLTIGDDGNVSVASSVYSVENSKPIYCHPISIVDGSASPAYAVSLFIFDNNPTPYTLDTFKAFVSSLYASVGETIRIVLTGGYKTIVSASLLGFNGTNYFIAGLSAANTYAYINSTELNFFDDVGTTFVDGVNKIN